MLPAAKDQPAYVLHRRAFRETSMIVELLTQDHGRVGAVVRGAKGGGRRRHSLEPFTEIAVEWRGRGQLVTVFGSESVAAVRLTGDALFAGLYVNELLVKTLEPQEPVEALFRRYSSTLAALAALPAAELAAHDIEPPLRSFEKGLLDELGYGMVFDADIESGKPIEGGKAYCLADGEGFLEVDGHEGRSSANGDAIVLRGREIAAIANEDFTLPSVRSAAKRVFRRALQQRLGGKRLHTRRLFAARSNGHE